MAKYKKGEYEANLGRLIDMEAAKKQEAETAEKGRLELADLEAYYRQLLEDHLNAQNVYTNPNATAADLAQLDALDAEQYNKLLNAWLAILQEQGVDINNNEDVWKYVNTAADRGWQTGTVGESGVDFDAINQGYADDQYRQARMAEGTGSGDSLLSLWLDEPEEKTRTWNGGVVDGHYVAPGVYTEEQWENETTSAFNRVGEDGLTDGQRMLQQQQEAAARRQQQMMASLIDGSGTSASRNDTTGWLSDEYPDINTNVANANTGAITLTDAGREYLAKLAAEQEAEQIASGAGSTLADVLSNLGSSGSYSGSRAASVGSTGLTAEETAQMQGDAYRAMLDAMARGTANTGGYINTAALQAANSVYDAYKDVLPDENRMASYLRYQGDSGNRAAQPAYTWLNRAKNGGYGTTEPTVTAPVTGTQQTQGSIGTIPTISGGTPVSGTPVGVQGRQDGSISSALLQLIGKNQPTQYSTPVGGGAGLRTPNVMRAQGQEDIRQYLNALLRR